MASAIRESAMARAMAVGVLRDGSPVIASGGDDRDTVLVWRLADGTPLAHKLELSEPAWVVALHGNIIVTAGGWDIAIHQPATPSPKSHPITGESPCRRRLPGKSPSAWISGSAAAIFG